MLYPLGQHTMLVSKGKFGAYFNRIRSESAVASGGGVIATGGDQDNDYVLSVEAGVYLTHRLSPRCTVRAGYEFWYLYRAALAPDQIGFNPFNFGNSINNDDIHLFQAFTCGAEFQW